MCVYIKTCTHMYTHYIYENGWIFVQTMKAEKSEMAKWKGLLSIGIELVYVYFVNN